MARTATIYVALLDEGVDVWRPVDAEHLHSTVYRIVQARDDDTELWQFQTGDAVEYAYIDAADGRILAAVRRVENSSE